MENINILNLPVEIIYLVFDHCDTEAIFSMRCVCKQFYAATNTYNRFQILFSFKIKVSFQVYFPSYSARRYHFNDVLRQTRVSKSCSPIFLNVQFRSIQTTSFHVSTSSQRYGTRIFFRAYAYSFWNFTFNKFYGASTHTNIIAYFFSDYPIQTFEVMFE